MNDETPTTEASQVQEAAPQEQEVVAAGQKQKPDFLSQVAQETEKLTKVKALNLADKLSESVEENYFRLGGVLKVIYENTWFEGYADFNTFVQDRFGFAERKAKYLMEIYDHLVTKQIPWDKVAPLGWTKLKDLARYLTPENVDEWVAKALPLTVTELQAMLKAQNGGTTTAAETTSDVQTLKFKLKNDQVETVSSALNKAKAELNTTYDSVAIEGICAGYLGNSITVGGSGGASLEDLMAAAGPEGVLEVFDKVFPQVDLTVNSLGPAS